MRRDVCFEYYCLLVVCATLVQRVALIVVSCSRHPSSLSYSAVWPFAAFARHLFDKGMLMYDEEEISIDQKKVKSESLSCTALLERQSTHMRATRENDNDICLNSEPNQQGSTTAPDAALQTDERPALVLNTTAPVLRFHSDLPEVGIGELSLLPSPQLQSDQGVFQAFSGTDFLPSNPVCRAPSIRHPDRIASLLRQYKQVRSYEPNVDVVFEPNGFKLADDTDAAKQDYGSNYPPTLIVARKASSGDDDMVIPKRGETHIIRSSSVGSRRLRTTRLHRETRQILLPTNELSPYPSGPSNSRDGTPYSFFSLNIGTPGSSIELQPPKRNVLKENVQLTRAHSDKQLEHPFAASVPQRFTDKANVYVAYDKHMRRSVWDRVRFIGKGSFSEIILATPTLSKVKPECIPRCTQMMVAVKITNLGPEGTPERAQLESALRRDVELLNDLSHPCLLPILAINMDSHRSLFILPYCAGGDLFELVEKHRSCLSLSLVRRIFADVVTAVCYLHQNDVVHRDIKLENVLVDVPVPQLLSLADPLSYPRPLAILTDLGLARKIDPKSPLLTTRCGSEDYVPPEILLGQPYDGRQTDSWALGVLLYTIMEGRLPFDPPPRSTPLGRRARLRTIYRIVRIEWSWYQCNATTPEWEGGKAVVESLLQRREQRALAVDLLQTEWVGAATGRNLEPFNPEHFLDVFIDEDIDSSNQTQTIADPPFC